MSKEEIFNYFYTNSANLNVKEILIIMLAAIFITAIIYFTYWITYRGVSYNAKFNLSLIIINLISVVIMLMISSNIVISLGMVGALSIVRFRTAIKDSRDTVFIFWTIAEGLCVGSQNFKLALITTLVISVVLIVTSNIPKIWNKYLLVITGNDNLNFDDLIKTIKPYILNYKIRTANKNKNSSEILFEIRTKGEIKTEILDKITKINNVDSVNYVTESGETVG